MISSSPQQEKALILAIRSCRSVGSLHDAYFEAGGSIEDAELIARTLRAGHTSILEHIYYTFIVENISLVARSQFFRHRHMSPTEQSKRSIDANLVGYSIPPLINKDPAILARYEAAMERAWDSYNKLLQMSVSKEDARYVLPISQHTQFVVTINGRELFDVIFPLRMCRRSQWEVRDMASRMHNICMTVLPQVFKLTGPKCIVTGTCNEIEKCRKEIEVT